MKEDKGTQTDSRSTAHLLNRGETFRVTASGNTVADKYTQTEKKSKTERLQERVTDFVSKHFKK